MNIIFEEAFISKLILCPRTYFLSLISILGIAREMKLLFVEDLSMLSNKTLAIDADILLRKVKASPKKSLQEGHSTLDMTVQKSIIDIIEKFK